MRHVRATYTSTYREQLAKAQQKAQLLKPTHTHTHTRTRARAHTHTHAISMYTYREQEELVKAQHKAQLLEADNTEALTLVRNTMEKDLELQRLVTLVLNPKP